MSNLSSILIDGLKQQVVYCFHYGSTELYRAALSNLVRAEMEEAAARVVCGTCKTFRECIWQSRGCLTSSDTACCLYSLSIIKRCGNCIYIAECRMDPEDITEETDTACSSYKE